VARTTAITAETMTVTRRAYWLRSTPVPEEPVDESSGERPPGPPPSRLPRNRRTLTMLLVPATIFWAAAQLGALLVPRFAETEPLLIVALNARRAYLALTADNSPLVPWFIIGFVRQMVADPIFFMLARVYGDDAVRIIERQYGGALYRRWEPLLRKGLYVFTAMAPNVIVCTLAGASQMRTRTFIIINAIGTVVSLIVIRIFGDIFSGPISSVRGFLTDYWIPLTIVGVISMAWSVRKNLPSLLHPVDTFEQELANESTLHESSDGDELGPQDQLAVEQKRIEPDGEPGK